MNNTNVEICLCLALLALTVTGLASAQACRQHGWDILSVGLTVLSAVCGGALLVSLAFLIAALVFA